MYILIAIIIALFVVFIFFSISLFNIVFRGYAPFFSSQPEVIQNIVDNLDLSPDFHGTIYELGCGQASFLRAMEKKYPKARLVGIEYALIPCISASLQSAIRGSRIRIMKKNIFRVDVSDADVIYCYLNAQMMLDLEHKFKFECKPLTKIVSYEFPLPHFPLVKMIDLDAPAKAAEKARREEERKIIEAARKKGKTIKPKKEKVDKHHIEHKLFFYEI